jgi:hypothetical protein
MKEFGILLLSLFMPLNGFSQKLVYRETARDKVMLHTLMIRPRESGYSVQLTRESESQRICEEFSMDSLYHTLEWNYRNKDTRTDISAVRDANGIRLSGTFKNENLEKEFSIDPLPWIQLFPIGLETLVASSAGKMKFYAISTTPPAEMNIAKFSAEIAGHEAISCNGDSVDAVHIRISLAGWKSLLWHGDCWFRTSDTRYIKWDAAGPPGQPRSVVELISE